jgi:hypothetical protein
MFFRRLPQPKVLTISERIEQARQAGFKIQPPQSGRYVALKGEFGAILAENSGSLELIKSGKLIGNEVGASTHVGYQMWFVTHSGAKMPATADDLKGLHTFAEDLRESLGLTSFYNESLGTTNNLHLYDRVEDRDHQHHAKPWEKAAH